MQPIIIIGAGPVGLATAILLLQAGKQVKVFDKSLEINQTSRAWSIHSLSIDLLKEIGIQEAALAKGVKVGHIMTYNQRKPVVDLAFSELPATHNYILSLPQFELEALLLARFEALGGELRRGWEYVSSDHNKHLMQTCDGAKFEQVIGEYLIGCDGSRSKVRSHADIDFKGDMFQRGFLVIDAKLTHPFDRAKGHTFLTKKHGYVMLYPLPDGNTRLIMDVNYGAARSVDKSTEVLQAQIRSELDQRGFQDIQVQQLLWHSLTRHREMLASSYVKDNVILAGDAAHIHSPAGGQGVNLGLQDAVMLAKVLNQPKEQHRKGLAQYAQKRRQAAQQVITTTNAITELYTNPSFAFQLKRRLLLPLMGKAKKKIAGTVFNLSGHGLKPLMETEQD